MERVDNDSAPRLTPEEAELRAAALIAQYRGETHGTRRKRASAQSPLPQGLGWVVAYLAGVAGGTVWHAKPVTAVLLGVPLVLIGRAFLKRQSDTKAETK